MGWGWVADWFWGLPLLILTVVFHVSIFVLMGRTMVRKARVSKARDLETRPQRRRRFILGIALIALGAAALHSFEASVWAMLYLWLDALPDAETAMLYSLGAITSYGHAGVYLPDRWRLLGAIEAMNGLILFGLTTAFLFGAIEKVEQSRG
ncbi:hypothetical protein [uncultured Rhodoblastus sp.]|uniref:hypothetical protein n=1 Tax=uncultured Rhodoblastus sp. TaxID=543037 RepID=UPI0025FB35F8|nr:hypothetical protein [uncultured Rhodoblastus sp.]